MRKICAVTICIVLLMVSFSFAQTPRQPTSSEGKTTFTNIAVVGLNDNGADGLVDTGLPGYIEMTSTKGDVFYLYIGYDGDLRIASEVAVGLSASPSVLGWGDASAPVVGNQT